MVGNWGSSESGIRARLIRRLIRGAFRLGPERDHTKPHIVTVCPEIRSAVIEDRIYPKPVPELLLFWKKRSDLDPVALAGSGAMRASFAQCLRVARDSGLVALVVPEPLWVRYWPRSVVLIVFVRICRRFAGMRAVPAYTYAIENLSPEERLTLPALDRWPRLNRTFARILRRAVAVGATTFLDGIVYGTPGAKENYQALLGRRADDIASRTIVERRQSVPMRSAPKGNEVLFVGELSTRKGLAVLLDAWAGSLAQQAGWRLRIFGDGPLRSLASDAERNDPTISVERVRRSDLLEAYAGAAAVVQPSQRIPRWREQCGLGALEAESFGCQIVLSSESGLADALAERAGAIVVPPGSVRDLRAVLRPDRLRSRRAVTDDGVASYPEVAFTFFSRFKQPSGTAGDTSGKAIT